MVDRQRAAFLVMVDLDPVPGWGHEPGDWQRMLEHYLLTAAGHYTPVVVEFTPADLEPAKHAARAEGIELARAAVERVLLASDDGTEYEHEECCQGEPTCPACWVADVRAALAGLNEQRCGLEFGDGYSCDLAKGHD